MNFVCEIKSLNLYIHEILMLWEWIAGLQTAVAASFAIIWTQTNCLGGGRGWMTCRWSVRVKLQQPRSDHALEETGWRVGTLAPEESFPFCGGFLLIRGKVGECLSQRTFRSARGRITLTWTRLQRKLTAHMEHALFACVSLKRPTF